MMAGNSRSDAPKKLSALYYPYSRCVDSDALKLLAILYEEVVFVDPLEELFREFLLSSDKGCQFVPNSVRQRWNENQESWNRLRDAGVIRIIDPVPSIGDHDALLTAAYAADMADKVFVETAEREGRAAGPWKMLESRIPPTVNKSFREHNALSANLLGNTSPSKQHAFSDYQIGVFAWEQYDHFGWREYVLEKLGGRKAKGLGGRAVGADVRKSLDSSSLSPYEQLFLSGGGTCTEDGQPFGEHPYTYVDTASFSTGEPIRILSFSQGASLNISQALVLADLHGLTPVTDNALHQQLLSLKYRRALSNLSLVERSAVPRRSFEELERYSIIARAVLIEALSPNFLRQLSLDEVLRFRQENLKSLERFWVKLRDLSHELDEVPIGPGFDAKLSKLIDRAVLPELHTLAESLENSKRIMYGSLLSKMAAGVPASTLLSLFAGMSGAQLLALSVGAGIAAFGIGVPSIVDYWKEKARVGQHWLTLVLDIRGVAGNR
jgi:hypothetical protein